MSFISRLIAFATRPSSRRSRRSSATPNRASRRRLLLEGLEGRQMLTFSAAVDYPAESNPQAIVSADFNMDGNLDLATTLGFASKSRVSVRLGNGAGGFGTAQKFPAPGYDTPFSIFSADLNYDSRPDLVVSEFTSFSTLIGNGDGTFQPAVSTVGVSMGAVGHFDNCSYIDGVVTWIDGDWTTHVQVYGGDGQGGFAPGPDAWYSGWGGMAAVDLNNDGKHDVVTAEGLVFLNVDYVLQFDWEQQAPLNSGGVVTTGDFTGDGNVDVIVAGTGIAVLRGRGDGTLDAPIHYSVSGSHTSVATADFNSDGKLDAVATDRDAATVSVMLGNGDGTLRYAGAFATGTSPSSVTVGDFNDDGRPDVAVANADSKTISVLLNDGDWSSLPPSLRINDEDITEGNTGAASATFSVTLSAASTETITVAYSTGNATAAAAATAGSDYTATSGTLTFAPGETSKTISVLVKGDRLGEPNEAFVLNLSNSTNATIVDGQGVGTIVDDEPQISIGDVTKSEGKKGNRTIFTFTVTLSAAYDQSVTMSFMTVNGTAKTGDRDYVGKTGTLTFAPGETTKTITIEVKGDSKKESDETFYLDLFGLSSNALFTKNRGIGKILNDD